MKKPALQEFWITNISNKNVSLSDLGLTIKSRTSVNLLDSRHYYFTLEELEKSLASGSLFKKRDKLVKRVFAPAVNMNSSISMDIEVTTPSRSSSVYEIIHERFEELEFTDEQYEKEMGEESSKKA